MTRPTDAAIARAWEEYCRDRQGHMVIITDAQFHVMQMAKQFDAESPAGTEPVNGPYCKYCGKETHHIGDVCFFCSKQRKADPAGTERGSEEVMQIETLGIQGERPVARGEEGKTSPLSEVPPGYFDQLAEQVKTWPVLDESKFADFPSPLDEPAKLTCTIPACRAEMRPGLRCKNPDCGLA